MLLLRRLLPLPAVVLGAAVLIFLLPRLAGVDTVRAVLRSRVAEAEPDPVVAARVAVELGLDRPLPEQFLRWLGHVLTGDLGLSFASRTPVAPQLASALGYRRCSRSWRWRSPRRSGSRQACTPPAGRAGSWTAS